MRAVSYTHTDRESNSVLNGFFQLNWETFEFFPLKLRTYIHIHRNVVTSEKSRYGLVHILERQERKRIHLKCSELNENLNGLYGLHISIHYFNRNVF